MSLEEHKDVCHRQVKKVATSSSHQLSDGSGSDLNTNLDSDMGQTQSDGSPAIKDSGGKRDSLDEDTAGDAMTQIADGSLKREDGSLTETDATTAAAYKTQIIWPNLISISILHLIGVYGIFVVLYEIKWLTLIWGFVVAGVGGFGVTAGVHRLWTHRAYSAKWPLRLLLALCYSVAGQNTIYDWVRDHRVHHKFSETDADPHNSGRGFFFAHVGWLLQKKHPDVYSKGRLVDMSDVVNDPVVKFHMKHFTLLKLILCFAIPISVPHYVWGETWYRSVMAIGIVRYLLGLNFTWLVNSAAHIWGSKPFDSRIGPSENPAVSILAMGEGWHNYHHVFPWDYKAAELGNYSVNLTTFWIDVFARIGWAYDLKQPTPELVRRIAEAHGDGTHDLYGRHRHDEVPEPPYSPIEAVNKVLKHYGIPHKLD